MWNNQHFNADWALNPSAYQNISHEDVDWASLAQQWIKMKEVTSTVVAPPPPPISLEISQEKNEDKGEEDMDLDEKPTEPPANSDGMWGGWPSWQQQQQPQQWGWNWPGGAPVPPVAGDKHEYGYTSTMAPGSSSNNFNNGSSNQPVYWTGQTATDFEKDGPVKPYLRSSRYSWRRDRDKKSRDRSVDDINDDSADEDTVETIDAAKRKNLPAWIREGLEKMEREKQRKIEKEKSDREREEFLKKRRIDEEAALAKMDGLEAAKFLARSKFDSDGEEVNDTAKEPSSAGKVRRSRFQDKAESPLIQPPAAPKIKEDTPPPVLSEPPKTREEKLEEVMLKVRRTLTEILLEVTNEEITAIAREVYQKARAKAPAKSLRKTQALSSIAGKSGLGLGMYGSDNESDDENESGGSQSDEVDSDKELEEEIVLKKNSFVKTAEDIERALEAEEEREAAARKVKEEESSGGESEQEHGQVEDKPKPSHRYHGARTDSPKQSTVAAAENAGSSRLSESTEESASVPDGKYASKNNHSRRTSKEYQKEVTSESESNSSRSSNRKKKSKKRKKNSSSDDNSEDQIKRKKKSKKKSKKENRVNSNVRDGTDCDESKRSNKIHDSEKRHKKSKKQEKSRKEDDNRRSDSLGLETRDGDKRNNKTRIEKRSRSRDRERSRERRQRRSRSRSRRRSRSVDSRRSRSYDHRRRSRSHNYRRSRSYENRRRRQKSRSRESEARRRSRSNSVRSGASSYRRRSRDRHGSHSHSSRRRKHRRSSS